MSKNPNLSTHNIYGRPNTKSSDEATSYRKLLIGGVAAAALAAGVAYNRVQDTNETYNKYQIPEELVEKGTFDGNTDEQLMESGLLVIRPGKGEKLGEFSERLASQLDVDVIMAEKLIRGQAVMHDGNPNYQAGEQFIFVPKPPVQP